MSNQPITVMLPRDLADLGVSVTLGSDNLYSAIDTDGCELRGGFKYRSDAFDHLRDVYEVDEDDQSWVARPRRVIN